MRDKVIIFDIETDGLLEEVTKVHCLAYNIYNNGEQIKGSITNTDELIAFFDHFRNKDYTLVGHNIIRYDIPVLKKLLCIESKGFEIVDTLALSWYLYPELLKHGLEEWGERFGVPKPEINDWQNLSLEEYVHRCTEDVRINSLLYEDMYSYLIDLYGENHRSTYRDLENYLSYKLDCAREQEEVKCKADRELLQQSLFELTVLRSQKVEALKLRMPYVYKYKVVKKPAKMHKKDGSLSAQGIKWLNLLDEQNLDEFYTSEVTVVASTEEPNPGSSKQLKDWLFSLGWQPEYYKESTSKVTKETKDVPQILNKDKVLCRSVEMLMSVEPAIEHLKMLSLINHRISVFEGFLKNLDEQDFIQAKIKGLTNTLRFKHTSPIANLPKVDKFYGEQIRGSIIKPDDDHLLCGSDMSALEDTTKQHYMYFFDPEYVKAMRVPGFDPHIDIGILAGMITPEEQEFFKWYSKTKKEDPFHVFTDQENEKFHDISNRRSLSKTVNFASVYGAGPPKISKSTGMPIEKARLLHSTYWERNGAVKKVAQSVHTKTIVRNGKEQMWLLNPISDLWYSLRAEKDIFSTLNQGSGVYCFDMWLSKIRASGIKISLQYHDEIAFSFPKDDKQLVIDTLNQAVVELNDTLKLNVPLGISIDIGNNYAGIH